MSSRPVVVSSGASEYRYVKLTEVNGVNISADTVTACLKLDGDRPVAGDFAAPASVTHPSNSVVIVGVAVSSSNATVGESYRVWAKIVDTPEIVTVCSPEPFAVI